MFNVFATNNDAVHYNCCCLYRKHRKSYFPAKNVHDHHDDVVMALKQWRRQGGRGSFPLWVKGKVFPYSLPSVGPGADPGVQAVSPQVT